MPVTIEIPTADLRLARKKSTVVRRPSQRL
jgi:hypothetical protein